MTRKSFMLALLVAAGAVTGAAAEDSKFFLHVGPAGLFLDEGAEIKLNGSIVPGASVRINDHATLGFEVGYFFDPNWAVSFTGGFPPAPSINGAGTVESLGKLGSILYGPTALTGHYHFTNFGALKPYVGAGAMFMFVFNNDSAALQDMKVNGAIGAVGQIGAEYMLTEKLGLFLDVKKAYLRTNATGTLYGLPVESKVRLDPLVINAGLTYRF